MTGRGGAPAILASPCAGRVRAVAPHGPCRRRPPPEDSRARRSVPDRPALRLAIAIVRSTALPPSSPGRKLPLPVGTSSGVRPSAVGELAGLRGRTLRATGSVTDEDEGGGFPPRPRVQHRSAVAEHSPGQLCAFPPRRGRPRRRTAPEKPPSSLRSRRRPPRGRPSVSGGRLRVEPI